MNTSTIYQAYQNAQPSIQILKDKCKEIEDVIQDNNTKKAEITQIYSLVMKNFHTAKLDIGSALNDENNKKDSYYQNKFFLNKDGITFTKYRHAHSSRDLTGDTDMFFSFMKLLKKVLLENTKLNEEEAIIRRALLGNIKEKKLKILKDFIEKAELLSNEQNYKMNINHNAKYNTKYNNNEDIEKQIALLEANEPATIKTAEGWGSSVNISSSGLNDELIMEQLQDEITEFYRQYKIKMEKINADLKLFAEDINKNFENQIILQKLKGK